MNCKCYDVDESLAGRGCIANRDIARGSTILDATEPLVFTSIMPNERMCEVCGLVDLSKLDRAQLEDNLISLCSTHMNHKPPWFPALKRFLAQVTPQQLDKDYPSLSFAEISMAIKFICLMAAEESNMVDAYKVLEANESALPALRTLKSRQELDKMCKLLSLIVLEEEIARIKLCLGVKVDIVRVLCIQWTNTFSVCGFDPVKQESHGYGLALFPSEVCMFNHSCLPNAARLKPIGSIAKQHENEQHSSLSMQFVALMDIKKGEEICIRYHESTQRDISEHFGFMCNCKKCCQQSGEACAFECPHCPAGLLIVVAKVAVGDDFICNTCLYKVNICELEGKQRRLLKRHGF